MNKTARTLITIALSTGLAIGTVSYAAAESSSDNNCGSAEMQPPARGMSSGPNFEYIFKQLDITEEQGQQVMDVLKQQHDAMQPPHQQGQSEPPSEAEMLARQVEMRSNLSAALADTLTNEQIEGFLDYLEAHMPQGRPHGKGGPGRPDSAETAESQ